MMMVQDVRSVIRACFFETVESLGGTVVDPLSDETFLLESGLDSLGFAVLVSRLEEDLGYDPFTLSDVPFYPRKFGEFVSFYEANRP
jgi:acyl carrier protein